MTIDAPDVNVHYVDLDDVDTTAPAAILDLDEQRHAERFRRATDRDRYVRAHLALRATLASYVRVDPGALVFDRQCLHCGDPRHGKPRLVQAKIDFNMSHADGVAVVAVTTSGQRVGVDVESVQRASAIAEATDMVVGKGDPSDAWTPQRLAELWTAKEAFAKACGLGLRLDLRDISVDVSGVRHPDIGVSRLFAQTRIGDHVVSVVSLPAASPPSSAGVQGASGVRWLLRPT